MASTNCSEKEQKLCSEREPAWSLPTGRRTIISSVCDRGAWSVITQKPYCEWGLKTPGHIWVMDRAGSLFPYPPSPSYTATALQAAHRGRLGEPHQRVGRQQLWCSPHLTHESQLVICFALCSTMWVPRWPFLITLNMCMGVGNHADNNPVTFSACNQGARQHPSSSFLLPWTTWGRELHFPWVA